ncbi:protease modulator HflC [Chitinivorax sp. PXF-14]|uniref:protease modulator HflC n=1 Tax=Chitinivorax sp. PXF-14 TaxID=3230488 RepID=UPI003466E4B8
MESNKLMPTIAATLLVLLLLWMSVFRVDQRQYAMVFQFGEVTQIVKEPGLHFKKPLLENVRYFDKRILTIDAEEPERFNTLEKKNVLVDSFIKWRIVDAERYYKSTGGEEVKAQSVIRGVVNAGLREEIGRRSVSDVISGKRDEVMEALRIKANHEVAKSGIEVMDVRLKRVDFPSNVSGSIYDRMQAERKRVANELRSEGAAESEKIRADADRQREVILAEAYRKAQELKGEGDAKAAGIYADAYGQNPEFYSFYRSLEAYRQSFRSRSDVMVLDPSADFFKYLKNPGKGVTK